MIIAGQLITEDGPGSVTLRPGWLKLEVGKIAQRGVGPCPHQADIGDEDTIISPGFVDAHVHLPQFDIIGAAGMRLMEWLEKFVFPAEAKWEDLQFAEAMIARVYDQFISVGSQRLTSPAAAIQYRAFPNGC